MSTGVDIKSRRNPKRPRSSAAETKVRVLEAAKVAFSRTGFDHVGVRELAALGHTDPAVVIRLFGSKEALFSEVAAGAFGLDPPFSGPLEGLGERVARHLLGPKERTAESAGFDAFQFLLRSSISPVAAPIVSAMLHESFVRPLGKMLGGKNTEARAALITASVLGVTTMRFALSSALLEQAPRNVLIAQLARVIQCCIERSE